MLARSERAFKKVVHFFFKLSDLCNKSKYVYRRDVLWSKYTYETVKNTKTEFK